MGDPNGPTECDNGAPNGDAGCSDGPPSMVGVGPPSPLTGCYLLIVIGEPYSQEHKDIILQRLVKGFLSWDVSDCHVNLEEELRTITLHAPEGEEARHGERLIQYASENLVTEILIHPQYNTLIQCMRNLLSSFTRHRHIIHAGYTFSGNGSWILQDGTFSMSDFSEAFQEQDVQRVLRAYPDTITMDIHCAAAGLWMSLPDKNYARSCKIRINPIDMLNSGSEKVSAFIDYLAPMISPATLYDLLETSDVVGNIRFSHPTLYVFPGGQGDAALFGINGFNMLVDGGFSRKACFWDFARHLDRLDAVLMTRINNCNINGLSAVCERKLAGQVYPQIGHFFCNIPDRRGLPSPDGDKDKDPLLVDLSEKGHQLIANLHGLNLKPQTCYREIEPINLYHKVGHGTLDMYVISPSRDAKEVKEFLQKWNSGDSKLFVAKDTKEFSFPIQNIVSICALLVWLPANPEDTITRILFPGSTPDYKIIEGLEKMKHLEFMRYPICSAKSIAPSISTTTLAKKALKSVPMDKIIPEPILPSKLTKPPPMEKDNRILDNKLKSIQADNKVKESKMSNGQMESSSEDLKIEKQTISKTVASVKAEIKPNRAVKQKIEKKVDIDAKSDDEKKDSDQGRNEEKQDEKLSDETSETESKGDATAKEIEPDDAKTKPKTETKTKASEIKSKIDAKGTIKSRIDSRPPKAKTIKKEIPEKKDVSKSSPTSTPKKVIDAKLMNGSVKEKEIKSKILSRTTRSSPGSTPAKSAKDANNRKVLESKQKPSVAKKETPKPTEKKEVTKIERKPISRRPKGESPSRKPAPGSPIKSTKVMTKVERDAKLRKTKIDKGGTTDSSLVSTPSADDTAVAVKKIVAETEAVPAKEVDVDKQRELDELKEEQEAVREIEAVFKRDQEKSRKKDLLSEHREVAADISKQDSTTEAEEEEEYLIIEKEEVEQYTEDSINEQESSITKEEEIQKHQRDSEESEKKRKTSLELTEEDGGDKESVKLQENAGEALSEEKAKVVEVIEGETKKEVRLKEEYDDDDVQPDSIEDVPHKEAEEYKEQIQEEVVDIISSAKEIAKAKTESRDELNLKTDDYSTPSPEDKISSTKKTTDTKDDIDADQEPGIVKEAIEQNLQESHPDEKFSGTIESGATTAPTLPEDERIPLDEIKEDLVIEEKYVKEETKETEVPVSTTAAVLPRVYEPLVERVVPSKMQFDAQHGPLRDIIKTPDEVADLPVHEEADYGAYDEYGNATKKDDGRKSTDRDLEAIDDSKDAVIADNTKVDVDECKFYEIPKGEKDKINETELDRKDEVKAQIPMSVDSETAMTDKKPTEQKVDSGAINKEFTSEVLEDKMEQIKIAKIESDIRKIDDKQTAALSADDFLKDLESQIITDEKMLTHDIAQEEKKKENDQKPDDEKTTDLSSADDQGPKTVEEDVIVPKQIDIKQPTLIDSIGKISDAIDQDIKIVKDVISTKIDDVTEKAKEADGKVKAIVQDVKADLAKSLDHTLKSATDKVDTVTKDVVDKSAEKIVDKKADDKIASTVTDGVKKVDAVLNDMKDVVGKKLEDFGTATGDIVKDSEEKLKETDTKIAAQAERLDDKVNQLKSDIGGKFQEGKEELDKKISATKDEVTTLAGKVDTTIKDTVEKVDKKIEEITGAVEDIATTADDKLKEATGKVDDKISKLSEDVSKAADSIQEKTKSGISSFFGGLTQGIKTGIDKLSEKIDDKIKVGADKVESALEEIAKLPKATNDEKGAVDEIIVRKDVKDLNAELVKSDDTALRIGETESEQPIDKVHVEKIVKGVAEILKSDEPLEEIVEKYDFPLKAAPQHPYDIKGFTTELRETHITTLDSPIKDADRITADLKILEKLPENLEEEQEGDGLAASKRVISYQIEEVKFSGFDREDSSLNDIKEEEEDERHSPLRKTPDIRDSSIPIITGDIKSESSSDIMEPVRSISPRTPEDVAKIVINVAEVLKSDKDLEEIIPDFDAQELERKLSKESGHGEEDNTETSTVQRMLVTASSEDGGEETVICPQGTIKFTPDVSGRTSPDLPPSEIDSNDLHKSVEEKKDTDNEKLPLKIGGEEKPSDKLELSLEIDTQKFINSKTVGDEFKTTSGKSSPEAKTSPVSIDEKEKHELPEKIQKFEATVGDKFPSELESEMAAMESSKFPASPKKDEIVSVPLKEIEEALKKSEKLKDSIIPIEKNLVNSEKFEESQIKFPASVQDTLANFDLDGMPENVTLVESRRESAISSLSEKDYTKEESSMVVDDKETSRPHSAGSQRSVEDIEKDKEKAIGDQSDILNNREVDLSKADDKKIETIVESQEAARPIYAASHISDKEDDRKTEIPAESKQASRPISAASHVSEKEDDKKTEFQAESIEVSRPISAVSHVSDKEDDIKTEVPTESKEASRPISAASHVSDKEDDKKTEVQAESKEASRPISAASHVSDKEDDQKTKVPTESKEASRPISAASHVSDKADDKMTDIKAGSEIASRPISAASHVSDKEDDQKTKVPAESKEASRPISAASHVSDKEDDKKTEVQAELKEASRPISAASHVSDKEDDKMTDIKAGSEIASRPISAASHVSDKEDDKKTEVQAESKEASRPISAASHVSDKEDDKKTEVPAESKEASRPISAASHVSDKEDDKMTDIKAGSEIASRPISAASHVSDKEDDKKTEVSAESKEASRPVSAASHVSDKEDGQKTKVPTESKEASRPISAASLVSDKEDDKKTEVQAESKEASRPISAASHVSDKEDDKKTEVPAESKEASRPISAASHVSDKEDDKMTDIKAGSEIASRPISAASHVSDKEDDQKTKVPTESQEVSRPISAASHVSDKENDKKTEVQAESKEASRPISAASHVSDKEDDKKTEVPAESKEASSPISAASHVSDKEDDQKTKVPTESKEASRPISAASHLSDKEDDKKTEVPAESKEASRPISAASHVSDKEDDKMTDIKAGSEIVSRPISAASHVSDKEDDQKTKVPTESQEVSRPISAASHVSDKENDKKTEVQAESKEASRPISAASHVSDKEDDKKTEVQAESKEASRPISAASHVSDKEDDQKTKVPTESQEVSRPISAASNVSDKENDKKTEVQAESKEASRPISAASHVSDKEDDKKTEVQAESKEASRPISAASHVSDKEDDQKTKVPTESQEVSRPISAASHVSDKENDKKTEVQAESKEASRPISAASHVSDKEDDKKTEVQAESKEASRPISAASHVSDKEDDKKTEVPAESKEASRPISAASHLSDKEDDKKTKVQAESKEASRPISAASHVSDKQDDKKTEVQAESKEASRPISAASHVSEKEKDKKTDFQAESKEASRPISAASHVSEKEEDKKTEFQAESKEASRPISAASHVSDKQDDKKTEVQAESKEASRPISAASHVSEKEEDKKTDFQAESKEASRPISAASHVSDKEDYQKTEVQAESKEASRPISAACHVSEGIIDGLIIDRLCQPVFDETIKQNLSESLDLIKSTQESSENVKEKIVIQDTKSSSPDNDSLSTLPVRKEISRPTSALSDVDEKYPLELSISPRPDSVASHASEKSPIHQSRSRSSSFMSDRDDEEKGLIKEMRSKSVSSIMITSIYGQSCDSRPLSALDEIVEYSKDDPEILSKLLDESRSISALDDAFDGKITDGDRKSGPSTKESSPSGKDEESHQSVVQTIHQDEKLSDERKMSISPENEVCEKLSPELSTSGKSSPLSSSDKKSEDKSVVDKLSETLKTQTTSEPVVEATTTISPKIDKQVTDTKEEIIEEIETVEKGVSLQSKMEISVNIPAASTSSSKDLETSDDTQLSGKSTPDIATIEFKTIDDKKDITDSHTPPTAPVSPSAKPDLSSSQINIAVDKAKEPSTEMSALSSPKDHSGKSSPGVASIVTSSESVSKSIATSFGQASTVETPELSPQPTSPFPKISPIVGAIKMEEMTMSGLTTPDMTRMSTPDMMESKWVEKSDPQDVTANTMTTITTVTTTTKIIDGKEESTTVVTETKESSTANGVDQSVVKDSPLPVRKESVLIKTSELRSFTPTSDDYESHDISSPRSDISSGQISRVVPGWTAGSIEDKQESDEEVPSSPLSTTSQAAHSPPSKFMYGDYDLQRSGSGVSKKSEFDLDESQDDIPPQYGSEELKSAISITATYKPDVMSTSFYGTLPDMPSVGKSEPIPIANTKSITTTSYTEFTSSGPDSFTDAFPKPSAPDHKFLDEADLDFEKALEEHRQVRGSDVMSSITSKYEFSPSKHHEEQLQQQFHLEDVQKTAKPITTQDSDASRSVVQTTSTNVTTATTTQSQPGTTQNDKDEVLASWGKPLGLPSPAPMPAAGNDNNTTPKKERKMIISKTKMNNEKNLRKRSESPVKGKKSSPIYIDLTYVPHHGNSYYSHVEFFKRVRARYYVFSGTEPSRDVYNALLEAKQTWEDKDLEVTIIPTYDTDVLGYWVSENEDLLAKYHIDLSPSASRCTINLQDHETSCSAYRLEF